MLKLGDPHLHFALLRQSSKSLNQLETTTALPSLLPSGHAVLSPGGLSAWCPTRVPQHPRHLHTASHNIPTPALTWLLHHAGCPFPQRNHDLSLSRALSNLHKIMQTRCFFFLASPACSI